MQLKGSYFFLFPFEYEATCNVAMVVLAKNNRTTKGGKKEQSVKRGFQIWVDSVTLACVYFVKIRVC